MTERETQIVRYTRTQRKREIESKMDRDGMMKERYMDSKTYKRKVRDKKRKTGRDRERGRHRVGERERQREGERERQRKRERGDKESNG